VKQVADSARFFVVEAETRRESLGFGFSSKKDECLFKEVLQKIFDAERKLKKDNGTLLLFLISYFLIISYFLFLNYYVLYLVS
jgi:hypothetical protein